MKNEKEELIDHISERLKAHEEAYKPGAWESFVQLEKNKKPKTAYLRRFFAAASILLILGLGTFLYFNSTSNFLKNNTNSKIVITPSILNENNNQTQIATNRNNVLAKNGNMTSNNQMPINSSKNIFEENRGVAYVNKNMIVDTARQLNNLPKNNYQHIDTTTKSMVAVESQKRSLPRIFLPYNGQEDKDRKDLYLNPMVYDNQNASNENNSDARKWSMGVVLTPAVGNNSKVNMGYGVAFGYRLSKKFSLNSGLAYTALSGSKDIGGNTVVTSSRTLQTVEADVTGLNIPIEIRYNFNDKLYASAGVSAMAVLSNSQQNHYAINQYQTSSFAANNGSLLKTQDIIPNADTKTVEDVPSSQLNKQNFAGFLNFSFGYKQKISNKMKSISVEPFISVPMSNNLANQNIHLGEMGVRFRIGL